jgi:hypothetical protein
VVRNPQGSNAESYSCETRRVALRNAVQLHTLFSVSDWRAIFHPQMRPA